MIFFQLTSLNQSRKQTNYFMKFNSRSEYILFYSFILRQNDEKNLRDPMSYDAHILFCTILIKNFIFFLSIFKATWGKNKIFCDENSKSETLNIAL